MSRTKQVESLESGVGSQTEETQNQRVVMLLLVDTIAPSRFEPQARRRAKFKEEDTRRLGDSIVKSGLEQPILVRPLKPLDELFTKADYEIVFGERRWLAHKAKTIKKIDCFVKELSDAEVIERQYQENHERQDNDPLDDAFYFKYLQDHEGYSIKDLSLKFSISEKAVVNKLKFNDLIEEAKEELSNGLLPLGHALYLSKFPFETQKKIVEEKYAYRYGDKDDGAAPLSEFKEEVEEHIVRKLATAPFNPDDRRLHLKGLLCSNCPERTGFEPRLFEGVDNWENDSCLNPKCFAEKVNVNLRVKREAIATTYAKPGDYLDQAVKIVPLVTERSYVDKEEIPFEEKVLTSQKLLEKPECEFSELSLCVKGEKKGESVYICREKTCSVHHPKTKEQPEELSEYQRKNLEDEFNVKVGLKVREKVFAEAIHYFDSGNAFWQYADLIDRLLIETLFARRYYFGRLKDVLQYFPNAPKGFDDSTKTAEFVSRLEPFHKSQLLFLITFAGVGDMSWRLEPQDEIKEIAKNYTKLDYARVDADLRVKLAPEEFKPLAQAYLDAVVEGDETAEIPKFWVG